MLTRKLSERPFITWERSSSTVNLGWVFLVISIISGATYSTFAKPLTDVFSPFSLLFVSEALTLFFLLFSFGVIPTIRKLMRIQRRMIWPLLAISIFSGTLAPLLWFEGLHQTSAVNAILFGNAEMVFMMLLATIVLRERWTPGRLAATGCIIAGIVTIALR